MNDTENTGGILLGLACGDALGRPGPTSGDELLARKYSGVNDSKHNVNLTKQGCFIY